MSQYELNIPGKVIEGMADNYSGAGLYRVTYHVSSDKSASFHTGFRQDEEGRFVKTRIMPAWNRSEAQEQNKRTATYVHEENDLIRFLDDFEPKLLTSFLPAGSFTVDADDKVGAVRRYVRNKVDDKIPYETIGDLSKTRLRKDWFVGDDVYKFRNKMISEITEHIYGNLPKENIRCLDGEQMDLPLFEFGVA